jgi:hypothetical protein
MESGDRNSLVFQFSSGIRLRLKLCLVRGWNNPKV